MLKEAYIVTDLGPGDGGKGSIVQFLAKKHHTDIVIKRGGAQGSHGVCTSGGDKFKFSQWGSATFEAVPTFCSEQMILSPMGLYNEAEELRHLGVNNPFDLLTVDMRCLCATPYHRIASQIEELLRKDHPRGTTGSGVGQAYRMEEQHRADYSLYAFQLSNPKKVRRVLTMQRLHYRNQYHHLTAADVLPEDAATLQELLDLLNDSDYLEYCAVHFDTVGQALTTSLLDRVMEEHEVAIVETSHGVLTDAEVGLVPHVSAIRTLPVFSQKMLCDLGYNGMVTHLAVNRAYAVRHGAGPMPTYDPEYTQRILPDAQKCNNRWQGSMRVGALDMPLLGYAINACEPDVAFQGLCLTCFDQVLNTGQDWRICEGYGNWRRPRESMVEFLEKRAQPQIMHCLSWPDLSREAIFQKVAQIIQTQLNIPLSILSFGPTEQDKVCSTN